MRFQFWVIPAVCASSVAGISNTASARSVDYSGGTVALVSSGQELKIAPLTTELNPMMRVASVTPSRTVDHITLALGMYCSAYKVENPISQLLQMVRDEWNAASPTANGADIQLDIIVTNASSYRRCVEVGEMNVRCIARVKLNGTARIVGNAEAQPVAINADIERDASVGGFCSSLGRGIGVISREAALALLSDAERKISTQMKP